MNYSRKLIWCKRCKWLA